MNKFLKIGGTQIPDLGEYLRNYVLENSKDNSLKIYVGCDSAVGSINVNFITAIVLYKEGKGGHIVYCKDYESINSFYDINNPTGYSLLQGRLLKEVQYSLTVAEYIEVELNGFFKRLSPTDKICDIDLDLNPDFGNGHNKSNLVFEHGRGWVVGNGYRVRVKPVAYAATCAADMLLK